MPLLDYLNKKIDEIIKKPSELEFQKEKKPFAGAFIVSFIAYNWELIFTLFNFDENELRENKVKIIAGYLNDLPYIIIFPALYALLAIITFYTFSYSSKLIFILFEKNINPLIFKIGDVSKLATREEIQRLKAIIKKQHAQFNDSQETIQLIREELTQKVNEIESIKEVNSSYNSKLSDLEDVIRNKENKILSLELEKSMIKLITASYGNHYNSKNVTNKMNDMINSMKIIEVGSKTFGDVDHVLGVKLLHVVYLVDGRVMEDTFYDGDIVYLTDVNKMLQRDLSFDSPGRQTYQNIYDLNKILIGQHLITDMNGNEVRKIRLNNYVNILTSRNTKLFTILDCIKYSRAKYKLELIDHTSLFTKAKEKKIMLTLNEISENEFEIELNRSNIKYKLIDNN